jgi:hypothetical protein
MTAYIGFDRRIEIDWLDETAAHMLRTADPTAVRTHLLTYLEHDIQGTKARENTALVLSRIWVRPRQAAHLRNEALTLLPTILPAERLWLHWGLTLLAFPFFRDIAAIVGRLLRIQGQCSVGQVTDRMIASWGERTTLVRATQRVLRSCAAWGTLSETTARGTYLATATQQTTTTTTLRDWFLEAILRAHETDGVLADELTRLPEIYPFAPHIPAYELMRLSRFEVQQQGSGTMFVYPAYRYHTPAHSQAMGG